MKVIKKTVKTYEISQEEIDALFKAFDTLTAFEIKQKFGVNDETSEILSDLWDDICEFVSDED